MQIAINSIILTPYQVQRQMSFEIHNVQEFKRKTVLMKVEY